MNTVADSTRMTPQEWGITLRLAVILLLRMLGLFMVLPVLSPWALQLAGHPGIAVGLAVGVYGLTQAILQIPMGWLSDTIGRRPVIVMGLALFVLGSILAAQANTVETLVLGRLLQGGGAIAAASTAWLADLLRPSVRSTAMAVVGISIGLAFMLALLLGPVLLPWFGVPGLFMLGGALGVLAIVLVVTVPVSPAMNENAAPITDSTAIDMRLWQLIGGVGVLHFLLALLFVILPLQLESAGIPSELHWKTWLPTIGLAMLLVFPFLRLIEQRGWQWMILPWAFLLLASGIGLLASGMAPILALALFFTAFNFLEASLPALLSRLVGPHRRGRWMGLFSSCQFFGIFLGSAAAALVHARFGSEMVYLSAMFVALIPALLFWYSMSARPQLTMSGAATKPR